MIGRRLTCDASLSMSDRSFAPIATTSGCTWSDQPPYSSVPQSFCSRQQGDGRAGRMGWLGTMATPQQPPSAVHAASHVECDAP